MRQFDLDLVVALFGYIICCRYSNGRMVQGMATIRLNIEAKPMEKVLPLFSFKVKVSVTLYSKFYKYFSEIYFYICLLHVTVIQLLDELVWFWFGS